MQYFMIPLVLMTLFSCTAKEEEAVDYDSMVMAEEEEWTSGREDKNIASDFVPDPQEIAFRELPEPQASTSAK